MKYLLSVFFLVTLMACSHGDQHDHSHHHTAGKQTLKLNNGKRWEVDALMKKNMDQIHSDLVAVKNKERSGKITQKDYSLFYDSIYKSTENIINNCKMPAEMDQVFHVILEELFEAAEELKDVKKQSAVSDKMVSTMMKYQAHFNHNFSH